MKKTLIKIITGISMLAGFSTAYAELFVNPVTKANTGVVEGSAHFGTSSVEYDADGSKGDIDRTFLGVTAAFGLNNVLDIYGTFSYTLEAEAEGFPDDDTGYIYGFGVRGSIPNDLGYKFHGYAQLLIFDEDYGKVSSFGDSTKLSGEETSVMFGVVTSKALENNVVVYGGLEINIMSDLDITQKDTFFGTDKVSGDRDDLLGIRLGANFNAGAFLFNINTSLIHESGILISASKIF